ncbi:MAG: M48 family metallopeptidase, partial [Deltaproteobacteria bacterium]|nr:M48 family metallopeptidase [Deltaproteobacteria bacterium]
MVAGLFLTFFFLELLIELTLNEKNISYVHRQWSGKEVPDLFRSKLGPEDFDKSGAYTLAKGRFQRWAELYSALVMLFVLFGGVLPLLEHYSQSLGGYLPPGTQATGILFCLATGFMLSALGLPTDLYSTFVIEERFGFNKTTLKLYLIDKLKGLLLGILIGIPFLFG